MLGLELMCMLKRMKMKTMIKIMNKLIVKKLYDNFIYYEDYM